MAWDKYLRGARGYRRIEVDAYGREFGSWNRSSHPRANIHLTLNNRIQKEAEDCWKVGWGHRRPGPRSGKVLALASAPTFSQEGLRTRAHHP